MEDDVQMLEDDIKIMEDQSSTVSYNSRNVQMMRLRPADLEDDTEGLKCLFNTESINPIPHSELKQKLVGLMRLSTSPGIRRSL